VADDLNVTIPRHSRRDMKVSVVYDGPIPAPIKKGDRIGKLVVSAPDIAPIERPVFAAANVAPIGTVGRMATLAAYLIWGSRH
jgi:D-alanyl-D-alanine carboxypeptidase (penicillin-binding protein 5/6)